MKAFFELLSQASLSIKHPEEDRRVAPVQLCPILRILYSILIKRYLIFYFQSERMSLESELSHYLPTHVVSIAF